jgi:DNA-directed RNA polymerase subunit alpha
MRHAYVVAREYHAVEHFVRHELDVLYLGKSLDQVGDAVAYAAKILKEQLEVFINFEEEEIATQQTAREEKPCFNDNLYRNIDELELSVRSSNCLKNASIKYIWELVQKTEAEMLETKNFGRKSLNEIKEILAEMGLSLGMKLDNWPPKKSEEEMESGAIG